MRLPLLAWECQPRWGHGQGRDGQWVVGAVWLPLPRDVVARGPPMKKAIGNVDHCFGSRAEMGWAFGPTHWQNQRKGHERCFGGFHRKDHSYASQILWHKLNAIEAIGQIDLEQEKGKAVRGISFPHGTKDPAQSLPKLHGFR